MKINLTLNAPEILGGYTNIDAYRLAGEGHILGPIGDLDEYLDDAECDTIIASDVLDYFSPADVDGVLNNWVGKLRHGGQLTVGGIDLGEVARQITTQDIDLNTANRYLYGDQTEPGLRRKATITLKLMGDVLQSLGLIIVRRSLQGVYYTITSERP